jgi:hypothetical protein
MNHACLGTAASVGTWVPRVEGECAYSSRPRPHQPVCLVIGLYVVLLGVVVVPPLV